MGVLVGQRVSSPGEALLLGALHLGSLAGTDWSYTTRPSCLEGLTFVMARDGWKKAVQ